MKTKPRSKLIIVTTVVILLIPLVAMELSDDVNWSLLDFIISATLLLVAVFSYDILTMRAKTPAQHAMIAIVVFGLTLLIWAELAVGLF